MAGGVGRPPVAKCGYNMAHQRCFSKGLREGAEGAGPALEGHRQGAGRAVWTLPAPSLPFSQAQQATGHLFSFIEPKQENIFISKQVLNTYYVLCLCGYWGSKLTEQAGPHPH